MNIPELDETLSSGTGQRKQEFPLLKYQSH